MSSKDRVVGVMQAGLVLLLACVAISTALAWSIPAVVAIGVALSVRRLRQELDGLSVGLCGFCRVAHRS